ncbi:MAG: MOSC domain-containing protein [Actinomycetota bacterium]|nr:MOSC domain-containing protein [Actinomycetota bacterium]
MGVAHLSLGELEAGLDDIRRSPANSGRLELIVRRPSVGGREVLAEAFLDPVLGLVGDTWSVRASMRTPDRSPHPDKQLTAMNARVAALLSGFATARGQVDRRPLAGDQLYLDLDLSEANLSPGAQLQLGDAVIEVTDQPHLGCAKFASRFGPDSIRFVNSPSGRQLRLRGLNARVVVGGAVRWGDAVSKLDARPELDVHSESQVGGDDRQRASYHLR